MTAQDRNFARVVRVETSISDLERTIRILPFIRFDGKELPWTGWRMEFDLAAQLHADLTEALRQANELPPPRLN
ncbi:hypothetical protein [Achromobacter xylosoxidans]|uniref:hypothetical protein n=1 Tax=Alcaligenes xylosoxydans xylosoxydans TaxID=85698 RepID=UPI0012A87B60|nr:hypothetical protein [Achromobacter xylosoxidans]CUR73996.1 hypothetical protein BN2910_01000 [Achromobacter xylosoxidans]